MKICFEQVVYIQTKKLQIVQIPGVFSRAFLPQFEAFFPQGLSGAFKYYTPLYFGF